MAIRVSISLSVLAALTAPYSAISALFLLLAAVSATQVYKGKDVLSLLMLGWLLWLPISLFFSLSPGWSLLLLAELLCLPLAWLVGWELKLRNGLEPMLRLGLPLLLLFIVAWGMLQGPNTYTLKPQGPFNDPNAYAALLNLLALPFLAGYLGTDLANTRQWLRIGQLSLLAAYAFVVFLVSSRGGVLALLLVTPLLIWQARKQPQYGRKLALLATVTLVSYFSAHSVSGGLSVADRLVDTVQGGDPARIMLMRSAWLMVLDHPLLGTGLGSFRLLYPQYRFSDEIGTAGGWVHNDYLQLWLEAGLPMFLLLLGVVCWVVWMVWCTLRQEGKDALRRMGYLAGISAILLHGLVNFLFFFLLISILVGLYLAQAVQVEPSSQSKISSSAGGQGHGRAIRLAASGYALLLGFLLIGQIAVDGLLGEARFIQRSLLNWGVAYPRYEVAYWVSVLAPFHPTPPQVMGLELADGFLLNNSGNVAMRNEALARMELAWQRAPCYLPYANDALALIKHGASSSNALSNAMRAYARVIVERNLDCNARHGLSYYYAGWLANSSSDAMMWWQAGMAASPYLGDDLLLATAILSRTTPGYEQQLGGLAAQMAQVSRRFEGNAGMFVDQAFWDDAQRKLQEIAGPRILQLVPPRDRK